ncbi:MAG: leucine-rich repeat protein, partial [Clostridia bacterium]
EVNGGSAVASQSVLGGSFATAPTTPTKANDFFEGWYNADMTTQFNFAAEITADTTVYAKWRGCAIDTFLTFTFIGNTNQAYSVARKQGAVVPDILVLPTEYNHKPVVAIDISSFFQCDSIKSVTISASITDIGIGAFAYCSSLTSIEVDPANPNFKSIDGNLYSKDGASLRQYVSGKKENSFEIPSYVTTIGGGAFVGCSALTSITIPTGVTTIEDLAFVGCIALTSLTIPSNVTSIAYGAFSSCFRLANFEVDLANPNYQSIDGNLYSKDGTILVQYANGKAEASFAIPSQVTIIGDSAFEACYSLTSMTIPSSVVSIGSVSFLSCLNLASVTFEAGSRLTTIGNSAFANCSSLQSITIPLSVDTIGGGAFANCSVLKIYAEAAQKPSGWDNNWKDSANQVVFDSTNTEAKNYEYTTQNNSVILTKYNGSGLKIIIPAFIGGNVVVGFGEIFKGNTTMQSVQIPQGVTTIAVGAFLGCSSLTSIEVDPANQNFKSIDGNLYSKDGATFLQYAKGKKDGSFAIPQGVSTIAADAFLGCNSLLGVNIPQGVTVIAVGAFLGCSSLTSIEVDPANPNFKSIDGNLYSKDEATFLQYASGKTEWSFAIPQTVTTIGSYAFSDCNYLGSVTIPLSVQTISSYAFKNCSNLTIEAEALSPQVGWATNWNHNCPVNYKPTGRGTTTDGLEYTFDAANQVTITRYTGTNTAVAIPATIDGKTVVSIDGVGFQGCSNLASVSIPSSIINIGGAAFGGCSGLKNITFEAGSKLTTIGPEAFGACGLTNITLPASVITISSAAFGECRGLKNITFEAGSKLTTIGEGAFMGCGLTRVTIPASVSTIAMGPFIHCSSLMSIEVERGNPNYQSIDGNLYSIDGTTLLQYAGGKAEASFAIPAQVTTIGAGAFASCGLTGITIPASVTVIGMIAFGGCSGLKNITFEAGSKLTTIGSEAFVVCGLTRVTIPASVSTIAMGAFAYCSSLMSIEVESGNPN